MNDIRLIREKPELMREALTRRQMDTAPVDRILALDEEIDLLVQRTHLLRKYRGQLLANRAQLYRDILKRSNSRT